MSPLATPWLGHLPTIDRPGLRARGSAPGEDLVRKQERRRGENSRKIVTTFAGLRQ